MEINKTTECYNVQDASRPKKIFIPTVGTLGDVKPFLILAKELVKRGHTVWLGVHPRFQNIAKAENIDTVEIDGDMDIVLNSTPEGIQLRRNPSMLRLNLVKRVFLSMFEKWLNGIISGIRDADLMILSMGSLLAGLSCIEKFPDVQVLGIYTFPMLKTREFSPPMLGGTGASSSLFQWINIIKWKLFEYGSFRMYNDSINHLRNQIGLQSITIDYNYMIQHIFHKRMKTATIYSKHLIPRPSDWHENDAMVGPIFEEDDPNFQPDPSIVEFLNKWTNEKVLYVGMGSMMSAMLDIDEQIRFLNNIHSALENNNCKAIISLVGFQSLEAMHLSHNGNIFYLKQHIPHSWLFSKISATIHHGGAGTTHAGVLYGLPSLILPFGADQPFNADRIFLNGLGPKCIPIRQTNVANLTKTIRDLAHENYVKYKTNATRIGDLMKTENGLYNCIHMIESEFQ